jgi:hypothetical protein
MTSSYAQALQSQVSNSFLSLPSGMPDYDTFFKDEGYRNIKGRQDSAYKRGNYDELDRLYEEEKTYNTAKQKEWNALKDSLASRSTPTPAPAPTPTNEPSGYQSFLNELKTPTSTPTPTPTPTPAPSSKQEQQRQAAIRAAELYKRMQSYKEKINKTSLETQRPTPTPTPTPQPKSKPNPMTTEQSTALKKRIDELINKQKLLAGAATGQRNYNEPVRPVNESPRGPYTPVKDYGTPGKPNFMPAGPSRDPWSA